MLIRFFLYAGIACFLNTLVNASLFHSQMWYAVVTLPGTALHELAHYSTAYLLDGSPSGFSVWPTWDANGNMETMGHIYYIPNHYNAAIVGTAPLLLLPLTAFVVALAARSLNPIMVVFWCWIAVCCWHSFIPSSADMDMNGYPSSWIYAIPFLLISFYLTYKVTRMTLRV